MCNARGWQVVPALGLSGLYGSFLGPLNKQCGCLSLIHIDSRTRCAIRCGSTDGTGTEKKRKEQTRNSDSLSLFQLPWWAMMCVVYVI